jgi:hypothetical protein
MRLVVCFHLLYFNVHPLVVVVVVIRLLLLVVGD